MRVLHVCQQGTAPLAGADAVTPADGFLWLDALHDECIAAPEALRAEVQRLTGARLHDLHLQDATNLSHPSYFDATSDYDMLVFRKLAMPDGIGSPPSDGSAPANRRRALQEIVTRPITFFVFDRVLVTVRNANSRTVEQVWQRLVSPPQRGADAGGPDKLRIPRSPAELMLRLLNGMVDRYLELRQPLTDRLDRWQRELLDPRRPFSNWMALLEARIELRKLENLSEEQYDALQELRDAWLEADDGALASDAHLVRLNDVMEHIQRVLNHARRLEATAESAVQLHFSAMTHRTNQIVRTLTVITAVFAPLSLIAGIFGMNFEHIPLLKHPEGFWFTMGAMLLIAMLLLLFFWVRRIIVDRPRQSSLLRWIGAAAPVARRKRRREIEP